MTTVALSFSLFGSVGHETLAMFVNVVPGVAEEISNVMLKFAVAPFNMDAVVQLMVPLKPTGGVVQEKAGSLLIEEKTMPGGVESVSVTVSDASGPKLVTLRL